MVLLGTARLLFYGRCQTGTKSFYFKILEQCFFQKIPKTEQMVPKTVSGVIFLSMSKVPRPDIHTRLRSLYPSKLIVSF